MEAPCQDGEGFGEWFEILLKIRRTKVVGIGCRVNPASGVWGNHPNDRKINLISVRYLSP